MLARVDTRESVIIDKICIHRHRIQSYKIQESDQAQNKQ